MEAVAPLSVLVVALLGVLVALVGMARITLAERRHLASRLVVPALVPAAAPVVAEGAVAA